MLPYSHFNTLAKQTQVSVRQLARLLCVRVDTINDWRKGRRQAPPGVLRELREFLGVETDE